MDKRTDWLQLERAVGLGEPIYTRLAVSERAGVDPELARRLWRALGFPDAGDDELIFTEADAEMLGVAGALAQGGAVSPDIAVQMTRVLGQSLARVADAQAGLLEQALSDTASGLPAAVEALRPVLESFLTYTWRRHVAAALHSRMLINATGGPENTCVGFADLVGFTAASQQRSYPELAAMVERFEALAYDVVAANGGRVIKMIGDEVMFSVGASRAGCLIALDIAAACASDPLIPSARVGLARGGALRQEGDLFGPTVNLASRLVKMAEPGTVLVSEDLARKIGEAPELALRRLRPQQLRGIGEVSVYVLRRNDDPDRPPTPSADPKPEPRQSTGLSRLRGRRRSAP